MSLTYSAAWTKLFWDLPRSKQPSVPVPRQVSLTPIISSFRYNTSTSSSCLVFHPESLLFVSDLSFPAGLTAVLSLSVSLHMSVKSFKWSGAACGQFGKVVKFNLQLVYDIAAVPEFSRGAGDYQRASFS